MDKTFVRDLNFEESKRCYNTSENSKDNLKKDLKLEGDRKKYSELLNTTLHELYEIVPEENHYLIDKLAETSRVLMGIEAIASFKEGLILGATELSYLSEAGVSLLTLKINGGNNI